MNTIGIIAKQQNGLKITFYLKRIRGSPSGDRLIPFFYLFYTAYKTFCRWSFLPAFRRGFLFVFSGAYKTFNTRNILGVSHNLPSMFDYINLPVGVLQSVLALFSVAYKTGLFLLSSVFFTLSLLFTLNADFLPFLLPTKH